MAVQEFVIRVVEVGANKTAASLTGIGRAAAGAQGSVFNLNNALRGIAAQQIGAALVGAADAYTNLVARTRLFASSQEEANVALQGVIDIAVKSRQPLDSVSGIYQRLSVSMSDLGKSAAETLRITETLTKATIISGASSQEAEGALRQFTQGLAANRLSGQELNSVVEQSTVVAQLLARELGVGVGQLRAMANQSRNASTAIISTEVALRALAKGADLIDERFAQLPVTFEQAFNVLKTGLQVSIGVIARASGITELFTRAIQGVGIALVKFASNAESVRSAVSTLRAVLLVIAAAVLPAATIALVKFTAAGIAAIVTFLGPIGLALAAAAGLLIYFRDQVIGLIEPLVRLPGILGDMAQALIDALKWIDNFDSGEITKFFESLTAGSAKATVAVEKNAKQLENLLQKFRDLQHLYETINPGTTELDRQILDLGATFRDFQREFEPLIESGRITKKEFDALFRLFKADEMRQFNEQLRQSVADLDPVGAAIDATASKLEILNHLFNTGTIGLEEYDAKVKVLYEDLNEIKRQAELVSATGFQTISLGAEDALIRIKENIGSASQAISDGFVGAFGVAENALNTFLTTGKFNFKDFARDIISEIQKVLTRLLVLKAINAIGGSGGGGGGLGGVLGSLGGLLGGGGTTAGRATGGPVNPGRPFVVGEQGRELFVPPTTGSIVPMQDAAPQVNVQVVNVSDPNEVVNAMSTREGQEAILNVISKNRARVKQSVS